MKTTREAAKEDSHKTLVHNLQELLEKNYDAEKGYKKALEQVKNPKLKTCLRDRAVQRNHFATELDKHIHELNEHPKEHTSPLSNLHRFWIDFKSAISKQSDKDILEECIRGEKASLKEYEEKLKKYTFPKHIEALLKTHVTKIKDTISEVKELEAL